MISKSAVSVEIVPHPKRPLLHVGELWAYREVLWALIKREIKVRYSQTLVGAGWIILQPLLTTAVLSILAGRYVKLENSSVPYPLFALAGLVPWTYFTHVLTKASGSLIATGLMSKAYFPRLMLPLAAVVGGLLDIAVASVLVIGAMIYYRVAPGFSILLLPTALCLVVLVAFGIGIWVAVANLYYRDVMHALPFATQILFFLTPVAYPMGIVPANWRLLYSLNPMTGAMVCWRSALLGVPADASPAEIAISSAVGISVLIAGLWLFRWREPILSDVGES
jgi:lipopolysaccharide transport system permease protein